jgi:hypothetical protein
MMNGAIESSPWDSTIARAAARSYPRRWLSDSLERPVRSVTIARPDTSRSAAHASAIPWPYADPHSTLTPASSSSPAATVATPNAIHLLTANPLDMA